MELYLKRSYFAGGCNGVIEYRNEKICETVELPWRKNKRRVSCIPEGRYRLIRLRHPQRGLLLTVVNVPNREGILIHPANFAMCELQGCIAPVSKCTAPGVGSYSRIALERLQDLVFPVIDAGEEVWLVIFGKGLI